jgi:hypothetical protein
MNASRLIRRCLGASLAVILLTSAHAQEDDFSDGNDSGWTRFAPLGPFGGTSYSVTGGVYRLACDPSPDSGSFGPARCASLRMDRIYSTFLVMVDIVDFDPAEDAALGILARIQPNPGPGTTSGYSFTYQVQDQDVQLSRVTGEAPTGLAGSPAVTLEAGGHYRMVLFGIGSYLEGRIYDMANPGVPLITNSATDETYSQGTCGGVVFSDSNTRTSGAFDNYSANDGTQPVPDIAVGGGSVSVTWPVAAGLAHNLYTSPNLTQWTPAGGLIYEDGLAVYTEPVNPATRRKFYRLQLGP